MCDWEQTFSFVVVTKVCDPPSHMTSSQQQEPETYEEYTYSFALHPCQDRSAGNPFQDRVEPSTRAHDRRSMRETAKKRQSRQKEAHMQKARAKAACERSQQLACIRERLAQTRELIGRSAY